jgi:hypothetical protein
MPRINALFKRVSRYGFTEHTYGFHGTIESADEELFKIIQPKNIVYVIFCLPLTCLL